MNNVHLIYKGKNEKLLAAAARANKILRSEEFYGQITAYQSFNNSALSPEIIARLLRESGYGIRVSLRWLLPAYYITKSDRIFVSGWELNAPVSKCVNLLIHETVYAIDELYNILQKKDFAANRTSLNASFVIGSIAEVLAEYEITPD